jgi:hypothetical protein
MRHVQPMFKEPSDRMTSLERAEEVAQRRSDAMFVRALAEAFVRGDHLPAQPKRTRPVPKRFTEATYD